MGDQAMTAGRRVPEATVPVPAPSPVNELVRAAHPLLDLACGLRWRQFEQAVEPLRDRLREMVDAFDRAAQPAGVDEPTRVAARYCLCTFVDEVVAATPSGGGGAWASQSLLILFHGEASGGERFFEILHRLSLEPGTHLDALELLYLMLALGMEGRYRMLEGGRAQLDAVREKLRRLIAAERGPTPAWPAGARTDAAVRLRRGGFGRLFALVAAGSLGGSMLLLGTLEERLHVQARPVIEALARLRVAPMKMPAAAPAHVGAAQEGALAGTLAQRLAPDLAAQRITLEGAADRAIVTLGSDGLFASGSAAVLAQRAPLLRRIGLALRDLNARIVVVGHTDDQPPSPGRPSNWQLSLARATEVVELLREQAGGAQRFLAQGRGQSEPIASNDSAAGRARNRRVVITVLAPGAPL